MTQEQGASPRRGEGYLIPPALLWSVFLSFVAFLVFLLKFGFWLGGEVSSNSTKVDIILVNKIADLEAKIADNRQRITDSRKDTDADIVKLKEELDRTLQGRKEARDQAQAGIASRVDALDSRVDSMAATLDARLRPLENESAYLQEVLSDLREDGRLDRTKTGGGR